MRASLLRLSVEHFALPIRDRKENGDDQRRDELQVVRIETQLQNDLQNDIIDDCADGDGEQLQAEVCKELAEDDLADDDATRPFDSMRPKTTFALVLMPCARAMF